MRQAIIRRKLEDGSVEETYLDLPEKEAKTVSRKKKSLRKQPDEDNEKQEEEQVTTASKEIKISARSKS